MDELKLISGFANKLLSAVIKKAIKKKAGCNINLAFKEVNATISEGKVKVHLDLNAEFSESDLMDILRKFNAV